jgi:SARP family transcriptional regulator, regulator of embCAB operon
MEASTRAQVRLLGRMHLQAGEVLVPASAFPGRQGRLAFAYLVLHRRPIVRAELAEAVWASEPPEGWSKSLAAIVSKLRVLLTRVGLPGDVLAAGLGAYELRLPAGVVVDFEAALDQVEVAEAALRADDLERALTAADVAANLARRPLLPGEEAEWLDRQRAVLQLTLVRALEIEVDQLSRRGNLHDARRLAEEAVELSPYRESAHTHLMRVHLAAGNRAEGLRAYQRCRDLLAEELGVDPSAETRATYQELLMAD